MTFKFENVCICLPCQMFKRDGFESSRKINNYEILAMQAKLLVQRLTVVTMYNLLFIDERPTSAAQDSTTF